jgi:hypothetical protein
MKTISEILIGMAVLACYCYTLIGAHILLSSMDKKIRRRGPSTGIININSVQALGLPFKAGAKSYYAVTIRQLYGVTIYCCIRRCTRFWIPPTTKRVTGFF